MNHYTMLTVLMMLFMLVVVNSDNFRKMQMASAVSLYVLLAALLVMKMLEVVK